jgi:hypothetical protein
LVKQILKHAQKTTKTTLKQHQKTTTHTPQPKNHPNPTNKTLNKTNILGLVNY